MKSTEMLSRLRSTPRLRLLSLVVALAMVAIACTDGSSAAADPDPTPTPAATNTAVAVAPTATPAAASDAERVDAAVRALNESGVGDLVAWDVLDSAVDDDGLVTLTLCGWTGDTVFDAVHRSLWTTEDSSGEVTATELGTSLTSGECLNTELIESALELFQVHDAYWFEVLNDPASFDERPESTQLFTDRQYAIAQEAAAMWAADGLTVKNSSYGRSIEVDPIADILWRRYAGPDDTPSLEIAVCDDLDADYGFYRDTTLVDDGKGDTATGLHTVSSYVFTPDPGSPLGWRIAERHGLNWAECIVDVDWVAAASIWRPETIDFMVLDR